MGQFIILNAVFKDEKELGEVMKLTGLERRLAFKIQEQAFK